MEHLQENPHIRKLYLADIGVPLELYEKMGISVDDPFSGKRFVHLDA